MTFSYNNRYLTALTDNYHMLFIDLNRMKVISSSKLPYMPTRIRNNPEETHLLSISGPNHMKLIRI